MAAWLFNNCELDALGYRLLRGGTEVRLEPKAFDLLLYLVENRERVVGKDELLERLWPGQFVSETALTFSIRSVRRAIGDDRKDQPLIRTVYGRGYQFIAECRKDSDEQPVGGAGEADEFAPAFVGRQVEMQRLCAAYGSAAGGSGSVMLIAGAAGCGKTRLVQEIASWASAQGAEVLHGRCYEASDTPPFWPWAEMLRAYVGAHTAAELRAVTGVGAMDLMQMAPALRDKLNLPLPHPGPESPSARLRLFDSIATFIAKASESRPLVLVFDDLHAADEGSLLLLELVGGGIAQSRALIVGTYRDGEAEVSEALQRVLSSLRRGGTAGQMTLSGLGEDEVCAWIDAASGGGLPGELASRIYAHTEGNPFFIEQTLRHMIEEGVIRRAGSQWSCELVPAQLGVPAGVREVLQERLARLSKPCRQALRVAAVVGREFPTDVVARVLEIPVEQLDEHLGEAERIGLVREAGKLGEQYAFIHALVCQTLRAQMRPARRGAVHRRLADEIDSATSGDADARITAVAHHAFLGAVAGEGLDKAVGAARRAAQHAGTHLAYEEAITHYDRALDLLGRRSSADQQLRCQLTLDKARAAFSALYSAQARPLFLQAAALAREAGDPVLLCQAAIGLGMVFEQSRLTGHEEAISLLREGLRSIPNSDSPSRAHLLARLAAALHFTEPGDERLTTAQEAVEIARRLGDRGALAAALQARCLSLYGTPALEQRLALASEIEALGIPPAIPWAQIFRMAELFRKGDRDAADAEVAAFTAVVEEQRDPIWRWPAFGLPGMQFFLDGRFEEAVDNWHRQLPLGKRIAEGHAIQSHNIKLSSLAIVRGELKEHGEHVQGATRVEGTHYINRCVLALLLAEAGKKKDAARLIHELDPPGFIHDSGWEACMTLIAFATGALDDRERAAWLYEQLEPFRNQNVIVGAGVAWFGSAGRVLGRLATLLERWDQAEHDFETGIALDTRARARPWLANTRLDYARMLLARGTSGDIDRAQQLLGAALQEAEDMGMPRVVEAINEARALAPTRAAR